MDISVVGISHHTAPVSVREAFALPGDLSARFLQAIRAGGAFEEALVLDTCNRTEVYFVRRGDGDALGELLAEIAKLKAAQPLADTSAFYRHDGPAVAGHLFRVAAALDSQIVGEHQILGQVKRAYSLASRERTARFLLNKLFHWAFRVGKRAQSETALGRGASSIPAAAVDKARAALGSLEGASVMLVGAGEMGALAAKALARCGAGRIVVANRSIGRAREVAEAIPQIGLKDAAALDLDDDQVRCPAVLRRTHGAATAAEAGEPPAIQAVELAEIPALIGEMDLVISATASAELVLTADELAEAIARAGRRLCIVDIAVPRDVDERLGELSDVTLHNIDDLTDLVAANLASRRAEVPRVEAIIAEELASFVRWCDSLQVTPTIKLLQRRFELLRQAEVSRYGAKLGAEADELDQFTRSMCKKILHQPIAFLRGLTDEAPVDEQLAAVEAVRRIFNLDELEGGE